MSMTVEEGAKLVISAGLISPDYQKRTQALADAALEAKPVPERID